MQALDSSNSSEYVARLHALRTEINDAWNSSEFRNSFDQFLLSCRHLLEKKVQTSNLTTQNTVFVCSGKSAEVSVRLLESIAVQSDSQAFRDLVTHVVTLSSEENEALYANKIAPRLAELIASGKSPFLFDEHAQDYMKASAFLSTLDRENQPAHFFVFAGAPVPPDLIASGLTRSLLVATKDSRILQFLKSAGRLISEERRLEQRPATSRIDRASSEDVFQLPHQILQSLIRE